CSTARGVAVTATGVAHRPWAMSTDVSPSGMVAVPRFSDAPSGVRQLTYRDVGEKLVGGMASRESATCTSTAVSGMSLPAKVTTSVMAVSVLPVPRTANPRIPDRLTLVTAL